MSDLERRKEDGDLDKQAQGPSLTLLYTMIALALVTAIVLAGLIVLPFYHRH
ncbi:MAG TPA: hypothetical protein VL991_02025 [Terracidiphilus sp.]|nr:hypothetical protein [Terracidiphilus sp.]